jgi:hypothetical protein
MTNFTETHVKLLSTSSTIPRKEGFETGTVKALHLFIFEVDYVNVVT